jgi:hypothetical protein
MRRFNNWLNKAYTRKDCLMYTVIGMVISLIYLAFAFGYFYDLQEKSEKLRDKIFHKNNYSSRDV